MAVEAIRAGARQPAISGFTRKTVRYTGKTAFHSGVDFCIILSKGGITMGIRNNLAAALRFVMIIKHLTLAEFAEKLEISRSALQEYLKMRGNPSIATVEHLAQKMGIGPSVLLTDKSMDEFFALLLDTFPEVSETDEARRLRLIELAAEMEQLLPKNP